MKIGNTQMKIYNNFLTVRDSNSEMTESAIKDFSGTNHLHNVIKNPTCFKSTDKPSCLDLTLKNFTTLLLKSQFLKLVCWIFIN